MTGRATRAASAPPISEPIAMPPRNVASTVKAAVAVLPNTSASSLAKSTW